MKVATVVEGLIRYGAARIAGRPRWSGVSLLITLRCNLRCAYCDFPREAGAEMDTETLLRLLKGLRRHGTFRLGISGGEPLLRADLGEVLRSAAELGFLTNLVTNGTLLRERIADLRPVDFLVCTVEGGPATHDAIRGTGSWRTVVDGLEAARTKGPRRLGIVCPVHRGNESDLEGPLRLAESFGIRVYYQPVQERAGWKGERFSGALDLARQAQVFRRIAQWKREGLPVGNSWPYLRMVASGSAPDFQAHCPAGRYVVTILPDGRVLPCCMVPFESGVPIPDFDRPGDVAVGTPACSGCTIAPYFENYLLFRPSFTGWWEAVSWLFQRPRKVAGADPHRAENPP